MSKITGLVFVVLAIGLLVGGNWLGGAVVGAIGGGFIIKA